MKYEQAHEYKLNTTFVIIASSSSTNPRFLVASKSKDLGNIHKPCGWIFGYFQPPLPPVWTNME